MGKFYCFNIWLTPLNVSNVLSMSLRFRGSGRKMLKYADGTRPKQ
jgi:hypothetical protein